MTIAAHVRNDHGSVWHLGMTSVMSRSVDRRPIAAVCPSTRARPDCATRWLPLKIEIIYAHSIMASALRFIGSPGCRLGSLRPDLMEASFFAWRSSS
jgi:hypothetical protein